MSERKEAYRAVLERFHIDPEDERYCGFEEAKDYLSGGLPICRYCVVTSSGTYNYAYADYDELDAAKAAAIKDLYDDVFIESPVAIIDLDTGKEWTPDFTSIQWNEGVKS